MTDDRRSHLDFEGCSLHDTALRTLVDCLRIVSPTLRVLSLQLMKTEIDDTIMDVLASYGLRNLSLLESLSLGLTNNNLTFHRVHASVSRSPGSRKRSGLLAVGQPPPLHALTLFGSR